MKKKNSLLFILLMYSLTMLAQKDITKFMGIPVDGFKKDMIQKLSVPFWLLRPLCVSYRLPRASILDIPVLLQAAGSFNFFCVCSIWASV